MKYKLGIFDWNGTLLDDSEANLAGSNATFRAAGVPELTMERYRDTMDFPLIHFYNRNGVDTENYLSNINKFGDAFFTTYAAESEKAPLRSGAMEALDALLEQDMTLMVLSNHIQEHLEEQMAARHVHHKFRHISGNTVYAKRELTRMNKEERLNAIMREYGYNPSESFIIGDSLEEPQIAKNLGLTSISVTWGCFARHRLEQSGTGHIIERFDELLGRLVE